MPPVGVNVIFGLTVTLPLRASLRFLRPLALITSFTFPAAGTCLAATAPGEALAAPPPEAVRRPGFGTVTRSTAVPFDLLFGLARANSPVGVTSAVRLSRAGP